MKLYKLTTDDGELLLRIGRLKPFFKRWFGSHGFVNQLAVYKALQPQHFRHLKVPELKACDDRKFLLVSYVSGEAGKYPLSQGDQKKLIKSVFEFHQKGVGKTLPWQHALMALVVAWRKNVRSRSIVNLFKIWPRIGTWGVAKGMELIRNMPRLKEPLLIHRDFKPRNVIYSNKGDFCLIDFELARVQEFGLSIDGVEFGFDSDNFSFDKEFLRNYLLKAEKTYADLCPDAIADLRGTLLWRLLNYYYSSSPPRHKREEALSFVKSCLLDDHQFEAWVDDLLKS